MTADVADRSYRVVLEDDLERDRIVEVDPMGELLIARQLNRLDKVQLFF